MSHAAEEQSVPIIRWRPGEAAVSAFDEVAREEPLEIRIGGRGIAVTMRTPGHDLELAAGFLLSEGIVRAPEDIAGMAHCADAANVLNVYLASHVSVDFTQLTRHVFASSSCGLCGKATIESVHRQFAPVTQGFSVSPEVLAGLPAKMRVKQAEFARTGGVHAAALFDPSGELVVVREDVGRHNAVDKVIGHGLLRGGFPYGSHVLLVSGRASFEIVQKALAARVPVICAVSAPSSLAVEFARANGQTLVGFLRDGGMNVYVGNPKPEIRDPKEIRRSKSET